jgi:putative sterol carrier protein
VPQFLTSEWFAALDASARESTALADALDHDGITVQQVVRRRDGGEITYYLTLEDGRARVREGSVADPELTLVTDDEIARALHRGDLNAQEALETGRFKLRGSPEALVGRSDLFRALGDVFAAVRADTTFAD